MYSPSDVLLLVESKAAKRIPSDPAFGFLGQPGELFYSCRSTRKRVCSFWELQQMSWERGFSKEIRFR